MSIGTYCEDPQASIEGFFSFLGVVEGLGKASVTAFAKGTMACMDIEGNRDFKFFGGVYETTIFDGLITVVRGSFDIDVTTFADDSPASLEGEIFVRVIIEIGRASCRERV